MRSDELCVAIWNAMFSLHNVTVHQITNVYAKTWSIVSLHHDGLAVPTLDAKDRLSDLLRVVKGEIERQGK